MPTVRYVVEFEPDDRPTTLSGDTRAVLAESCEDYDIGQGGLTREEVHEEDIADVITYPVGSELFVESTLWTDCLDDTTDETAARTRIWWRVIVVE